MPWRDEPTFYHVLVSEIMLQQTQVSRVRIKYASFMDSFPTVAALANAPLADVLREWQGLGYNRRAKYLLQAAQQVTLFGEPTTTEGLAELPGIGRNTAAAMMNYVYRTPTPFVETNIRTVYFHHFFSTDQSVSDADILSQVEETMDADHPREWFWALMDYGADLKSKGLGRLDMSRHYRKQPPLKGSVREMRGCIIRELSRGPSELKELYHLSKDTSRYSIAIQGLAKEGLIIQKNSVFELTNHGQMRDNIT